MAATITVRKRILPRLRRGHQWVFSNEVVAVEGEAQPGEVATLTAGGKRVGSVFYHPHALIAARLLTTGEEPIDAAFYARRLSAARAYRARILPGAQAYRLCHGEGDFLPGLIVDWYNGHACVQTLCAGMERALPVITELLAGELGALSVIERNTSVLRRHEELPERTGVLFGSAPEELDIEEDGARFTVNLLGGQKTGFFFDQRDNRRAARALASGGRVLDAYCNEGAFAVHCALGGAAAVLGLDSSAVALERARANAALNGLGERCRFERGEVPELLRALREAGERYDLIILDPPSFAHTKKAIPAAKKGYRAINEAAMRLLQRGGFLVTSSCSHHLRRDTFERLLEEAAEAAGRCLRVLEWRGQALDHPVLAAMPETAYLKCCILQIL
ncbi:MAG: class I SAM-dependent rRNA methyltransferase [Candidatus Tectomicrobia bacterium]|nr:class I SAM-dependent rRNA methyltransferase [Candidatus Tectomicrobia bacterium]